MKSASIPLRMFFACTRGVASIEFAFVALLLVPLLVGTLELSRLATARQHMEDYAISVANDLSGTSTNVSANALREMIERIGFLAPELVDPNRAAWQPGDTDYLGVTISLVMLTPDVATCRSACSYTAKLAWTFGNNKRACNVNPTIVGAAQPGPIAVVDVKSQYQFVFGVGDRLGAAPLLTSTTWLPLRNWRGSASFPAMNATFVSATQTATYGSWSGTKCF